MMDTERPGLLDEPKQQRLYWSFLRSGGRGHHRPLGRYKGPVVALCSGDVWGSDEIARLSFIIRLTNAPATPAIVGEATKREVFPVRIVFLQSQ